ncbi:MAG: hypothetical protein AAB288_06340 [Acidobacteriota bacterium]
MNTVLTSIIAALITAGIIGVARSRHLYLLLPKLHFYSPLSSGTTIQITLINGGFRTEENITVHFNPGARHELLAASRPDISVSANGITLPRLNRFSRATILLIIEGRTFDRSDIVAVESKEAVGKIVEKAEQVSSLLNQFIGTTLLLCFVFAAFLYGTWFGAITKTNFVSYIADRLLYDPQPISAKEIEWADDAEVRKDPLFKKYKGKTPIRVEDIFRKGNTIVLTIVAENITDDNLVFGASVTNPLDEDQEIGYRDRAFYDVMVFPNETKKRELLAYVPAAAEKKAILVEFRVRSSKRGKSYFFSQLLRFD